MGSSTSTTRSSRPSPGSIPTAGPIINQDVAHVTHRDTVKDLARLGREVERRALARAVRWYLEDRVLVDGNRTVAFE
jgi:formyltetrahydrofolate deformylase